MAWTTTLGSMAAWAGAVCATAFAAKGLMQEPPVDDVDSDKVCMEGFNFVGDVIDADPVLFTLFKKMLENMHEGDEQSMKYLRVAWDNIDALLVLEYGLRDNSSHTIALPEHQKKAEEFAGVAIKACNLVESKACGKCFNEMESAQKRIAEIVCKHYRAVACLVQATMSRMKLT